MSRTVTQGRGKRKAVRPRGLGRALRLTLLTVLGPVLVAALVLGLLYWRSASTIVTVVARPHALLVVGIALGVGWLLWMAAIWATYLVHRPRTVTRGPETVGALVVALLCTAITVPMAVGVRYAADQRDFITTVFRNEHTATAPVVTAANPWGHRRRVNVLLLGGDGAVHRPGVRTDSMMLASISVKTGSTLLFSVPRNLERVPFPPGSPLAKLYPDGFTGEGDPDNYLLNAVYRNIPAWHPGILGKSDNEGADAIKEAISGALGIRVDYYVLVNLSGFKQIVDAIGGITVNINAPVPVGGDYALNKQPDYWIPPGPDQHLDGFHALWYSRGRYGSSDYSRMERQRCALDAIVKAADPITLFRRYGKLVDAGKKLLRTDIPQSLLPDFVQLALKVKGARMKSVGFERTAAFNPNDPDFDYMHRRVALVIHRQERRDAGKRVRYIPPSEGEAESDTEADCQYHPVDGTASATGADGSTSTDPSSAQELPRGLGTPTSAVPAAP